MNNFDAAIDAEDLMIEMSDKIYDEIEDGTFPDFYADIPRVNLTVDVGSLTYGYAEVICGQGYTADNEDLHCGKSKSTSSFSKNPDPQW